MKLSFPKRTKFLWSDTYCLPIFAPAMMSNYNIKACCINKCFNKVDNNIIMMNTFFFNK